MHETRRPTANASARNFAPQTAFCQTKLIEPV
jgi:hypothetical protein